MVCRHLSCLPQPTWAALILLFSCAEPFDDNRHDLTSFRIAAASAVNGVGDAVIWSGEGQFHSESPTLAWKVDGEIVAEGFNVVLPVADNYELTVTNSSNETKTAIVKSGDRAIDFSVEIEQVSFNQYDLTSRSEIESTTYNGNLPLEAHIRLMASNTSTGGRIRWMSSLGIGTFLELTPTSTDFLFKDISYDAGNYVAEEEYTDAQASILALHIDTLGNTSWRWLDIHRENNDLPYLMLGQKSLQTTNTDILPGLISGTITIEDSRLLLSNVINVDAINSANDYPCANIGETFNLEWIYQGRCPMSELNGETIVLEYP